MRYKFWLRMLRHRTIFRELMASIDGNPLLQAAVMRRRTLLTKPFRAYVTTHYSIHQRFTHLMNHYCLQESLLGLELSHRVLKGVGLRLAGLSVNDTEVDLVLGYRGMHDREGELMLMLLDSATDKRLYSTALSLMEDAKGEPVLCVGTLQGNRDQGDWVKGFARRYHGLRPQAFMLGTVQMLAKQWSCKRVAVVDNDHHVYRARKHTARKRSFDLDLLVSELGGESDGQGWLWLDSDQPRRPLEQIASKKRSQYRKRYAWLDEIEWRMARALRDGDR